MKKFLFMVSLMATLLVSACADSGNDNNTPAAQSYNITGKINYAGKTISSAKVCLDVNNNGLADDTSCVDITDNNYNFTSVNNTAYYPLVAFIKEANTSVNAKITVDNNEYDSILYTPRGKTDDISIATTLAKSLMDKDSSLKLTNAEEKANNIIKKADKLETVLKVYNNALNTAPNSIDISKSIRGLVSVITDKINIEVKITDSTAIAVTQKEIDTANDAIKAEDNKLPQEPVTPDDSTKTPLEKVTEMLAGAEIKNSAETPVNLNEHLDSKLNSYNSMKLGIKSDAFGEFSTEKFASQMSMAGHIGYAENGWPSDKQGFEVFPDEEGKTGYTFTNYHSSAFEHSDACKAGKVNGITYKPVIEEAVNNNIQTSMQECVKNSGIDISTGGQFNPDDMDKMMKCYADSYYQYKDSIKIEKWYWTIDTTLIDVCKNGSSSNINGSSSNITGF